MERPVVRDGSEPEIRNHALHEELRQGRPATLAVPTGDGMVVAFNFKLMHRDLNRPDYRLLWKEIPNWSFLKPSVEHGG